MILYTPGSAYEQFGGFGNSRCSLVACKIALLQGNNDHYPDLILDAFLLVLNETHVNDLLCAALSKMACNEQSALYLNHGRKKLTAER